MTLNDLAVGQSARIKEVMTHSERLALRLSAFGFVRGREVRCLYAHLLNTPRAYLVGDTVTALGNEVAKTVLLYDARNMGHQ